ncbi:Tbc1 domain family member 14, partial [Globisporangium splendens]
MSVAPPHEALLQGYLHKQVDDQNQVVHLGNFVIELKNANRRIYLSAATEQERTTWVNTIRSLQTNDPESSSETGSMALLRNGSESILNTILLPSTRANRRLSGRRNRGSKDRRDERKRQRLPKMKKSFSELWVEDVFTHSAKNEASLVEGLCFAGIPKEMRGRAWAWILGNKLQVNEDLFNICKARATAVRREMVLKKEAEKSGLGAERTDSAASLTSSASLPATDDSNATDPSNPVAAAAVEDDRPDSKEVAQNMLQEAVSIAEMLVAHGERSIRLVNIDMPRTFGHHPLFQAGADGTERTTEVLEAYICYRPDLGYVQGMSYIAAALCFHMDSFTAFKALVSLMSTSLLFDMFRLEEKRTFHYLGVYNQIVEFELPRLHAHFQDAGIEAQMYAVDWALSLFTRSLPLNLALRIWDCFVLIGTPFFFQASVGILALYEDALLAMDAEEIMRFLHNIPKSTSATDLFDAIESVALSSREITELVAGGKLWSPDSSRHIQIQYPETYD